MEARSEIYRKIHVKYSFAVSRNDCVRHPNSDNVYETCLFSRNFSNLNKIFKTQKGKPILGQKLPNIMPFQMVPCMGAYSEFHH